MLNLGGVWVKKIKWIQFKFAYHVEQKTIRAVADRKVGWTQMHESGWDNILA